MSLYILGDLHFSALRPWRLPTGDAFLSWLSTLNVNLSDELLVLGDLTDDAVNPGKVVRQLEEFAQISTRKFSHVYILKGNHDEKLYRGLPHLSYEFLGLKDKITILSNPAEVLTIAGIKILSLPFYVHLQNLPPMWDYYAKLPDSVAKERYNLIIGHFADTSAPVFESQIDISYLNTDLIALGHIHTRVGSHYVGSIAPCKISENTSNPARAIWKLDNQNGLLKKMEIPLPTFCEFRFWDYPKPMPKTDNIVVWTINGCDIDSIAKAQYPDAFIRGVVSDFQKKTDRGTISSDEDFKITDPIKVFDTWAKESKATVSRPAAKLLKLLLTPPTVNPSPTTN